MSRHTDRRTVLQTTGGLLAGATILAGPSAAQEESLQMNIQRERIDPERNTPIPVEVAFPDGVFSDGEFFPDGVFMGVRQGFGIDPRAQGDCVFIERDFRDGDVANPVRAREVRDGHWRLQFATGDIFFPDGVFEEGEASMGLGMFSGGVNDCTPRTKWDTDTVGVVDGIF